jgi:hypothetical protein
VTLREETTAPPEWYLEEYEEAPADPFYGLGPLMATRNISNPHPPPPPPPPCDEDFYGLGCTYTAPEVIWCESESPSQPLVPILALSAPSGPA